MSTKTIKVKTATETEYLVVTSVVLNRRTTKNALKQAIADSISQGMIPWEAVLGGLKVVKVRVRKIDRID